MTNRDERHLDQVRRLAVYYPPDAREPEFWWDISEAERNWYTALSAGTAAQYDDPERLYDYWRRQGSSAQYIEDWIARVKRHLDDGTAGGSRRMVDEAWLDDNA